MGFGQTLFHKTVGDQGIDWYTDVLPLSEDSSFLICGQFTPVTATGWSQEFIGKISENGDVLWIKRFDQGWYGLSSTISKHPASGFVIGGRRGNIPNSWNTITRINGTGDTLWSKGFQGLGKGMVDLTLDTGYVLTGVLDPTGLNMDIHLTRTDSLGNLIWSQSYGSVDLENSAGILSCSDGGFLITAETQGFNGFGLTDFLFIKTDGNGDTLWSKIYGAAGNEYDMRVWRETYDGGFIVYGNVSHDSTSSKLGLLMRLDSNGDTMWTRTYGDTLNWEINIVEEKDGEFTMVGYTDQYGSPETVILQCDTLGDTLWTKRLVGLPVLANPAYRTDYSIRTSDQGYLFIQNTSDIGSGSVDILLIKTDSNLTGNCIQPISLPVIVGSGGINYQSVSPTLGVGTMADTAFFTVSVPVVYSCDACNPPLNVSLTGNSGCPHDSIGQISTLVSGGVTPYSYQWPTGDTTPIVDSLTLPWTYYVTVTDSTGCPKVNTIIITEEPLLNTTGHDGSVLCQSMMDGVVDVEVYDGALPYTFLWSTGDTTSLVDSLGPGIYYVTTTDSCGYSIIDTMEVAGPDSLTIVIDTLPPVCYNGAADAYAYPQGGLPPFQYIWSNGTNTWWNTAITSGTFSLTVTDSCGTVAVDSVTILNPPELFIDSIIVIPDSANNSGQATVFVSNGVPPYVYVWSDPLGQTTQTATGLSAGPLYVLVEDSRIICDDDSNIFIPCVSGYFMDSMLLSLASGDSAFIDGNWQTSNGYFYDTVPGIDQCDSVYVTNLIIGIEQNLHQSSWAIHPNPTTGVVMLDGLGNTDKVQVLDLFGRRVPVSIIPSTSSIDLSGLPNGVYFIKAGGQTKKVILSR